MLPPFYKGYRSLDFGWSCPTGGWWWWWWSRGGARLGGAVSYLSGYFIHSCLHVDGCLFLWKALDTAQVPFASRASEPAAKQQGAAPTRRNAAPSRRLAGREKPEGAPASTQPSPPASLPQEKRPCTGMLGQNMWKRQRAPRQKCSRENKVQEDQRMGGGDSVPGTNKLPPPPPHPLLSNEAMITCGALLVQRGVGVRVEYIWGVRALVSGVIGD